MRKAQRGRREHDGAVEDCAECARRHVQRLPGEYFASPVAAVSAADGPRLYCMTTDGRCSVLTFDPTQLPSPKPELLEVNTLPGTFYATPAITHDGLWLRAWDRLYRVSDN